MAGPTVIDFGQILLGNGATPTEVFTPICGIEGGSVNQVANTNDRFVRDCDFPGRVPTRQVITTSRQWDVTGSGLANPPEFTRLNAALGVARNYRIVVLARDGTDAGKLLGTYSGRAVLTASNLAFAEEGGTAEITLAGNDTLTWVVAP